jgi:sialate O-acetylesterase
VTGKPAVMMEGTWAVCSPETVGSFSAVGYFYGRELHKSLNVPVGLIHTSWGGTPAESWTERSALEADSDLRPILERWDQQFTKYMQELPQQANAALEKWKPEAEKADAAGRTLPPLNLPDPRSNPWRPAGLYNAMITPLLPYAIKGAIWSQGESNAGRAYQYRKLLPAMIGTWRKAWGQGDFPFYIVSLANFTPVKPEPGDSDWAELREAQTMTQSLPKTGQAVIIDIGDGPDIHPKNKQDVGRRLARQALKKDYDVNVVESGPTFDTMSIEGDTVRVRFKNLGGGLVSHESKLTGFAVAGEDKKFVWADAKIEGDAVVLKSLAVGKPVAVRYGWANNPEVNLYNKEGLPASPFRTDDWVTPPAPQGKK